MVSLFACTKFDLLLDVGANVGQFGSQARACGYRGAIVSFEPNPAAYNRLSKKASPDSQWHVRGHALGRAEETLQLNVMKSDDFTSFLNPSQVGRELFRDGSHVTGVVEAPVKRLDDVLDDCLAETGSSGDAILLKMDTQGFDNAVLDGAEKTLTRVSAVISEVSVRPIYDGAPRYLESLARLEGLGFELVAMLPVSRDKQRRVIEFNCIMTRQKS